jgi:hypothetical protein
MHFPDVSVAPPRARLLSPPILALVPAAASAAASPGAPSRPAGTTVPRPALGVRPVGGRGARLPVRTPLLAPFYPDRLVPRAVLPRAVVPRALPARSFLAPCVLAPRILARRILARRILAGCGVPRPPLGAGPVPGRGGRWSRGAIPASGSRFLGTFPLARVLP